MTKVSYTITAKELATPHNTTSYKDVLEAKEKLHEVRVTTNYEPIPEPRGKMSKSRELVLKYFGRINPNTFKEDYAIALIRENKSVV